jgi:K+-transporting ATPase ATPase C chain
MLLVIRRAIVCLISMVILTGLIYPIIMTGIAKVCFPKLSHGSLITGGGKVLGSELIGQQFENPRHFWSRPSATTPVPYNAASSNGSNLGPTNPDLIKAVQARIKKLQTADPDNKLPIPADLVTASGSGLDPDISPAAAKYQAARVARERGLSIAQIQQLVAQHTQGRQWGFLGEPRVNVLALNLALDEIAK